MSKPSDSGSSKPSAPPRAAAIPAVPLDSGDDYAEYRADPRLERRFGAILDASCETTVHDQDLAELVNSVKDPQQLYDELRLYKRRVIAEIRKLEDNPFVHRAQILDRLSMLALALLRTVHDYVLIQLNQTFGHPGYMPSYQGFEPTEMAMLSMGKLGAREINYESDLDLVFIYAHIGETRGPKIISNGEFFSKCVQRLINMLSVQTGAGRLYEIDTELRPSGHSGTLVTSTDHFLDHQMNHAQYWERQALLRAHADIASPEFAGRLNAHLEKLCYERPLPSDFITVMGDIRQQVLKEKVRESDFHLDLKLGPGGIMDIEFILHALQLRFGQVHRALRQRSCFKLLAELAKMTLLGSEDVSQILSSYTFFRTVESTLQLEDKRAFKVIDCRSESFKKCASVLQMSSPEALRRKLLEAREVIMSLYKKIYLTK